MRAQLSWQLLRQAVFAAPCRQLPLLAYTSKYTLGLGGRRKQAGQCCMALWLLQNTLCLAAYIAPPSAHAIASVACCGTGQINDVSSPGRQ